MNGVQCHYHGFSTSMTKLSEHIMLNEIYVLASVHSTCAYRDSNNVAYVGKRDNLRRAYQVEPNKYVCILGRAGIGARDKLVELRDEFNSVFGPQIYKIEGNFSESHSDHTHYIHAHRFDDILSND